MLSLSVRVDSLCAAEAQNLVLGGRQRFGDHCIAPVLNGQFCRDPQSLLG